jgi:TPR repeat protein
VRNVGLYEKAAEQGNAEAQYWLACCYFDGACVEQNNELALNWLEKAANHDHAEAEIRLADCYAQGIYVEKSNEQAYVWHTKAAEKSHAESQYWLAQYYFNGGIFEQLGEIDRKILEQDADSHPEYWRNVYLEKGYERAFNWAKKAVENSCGEAYLLLGFMFAYELGVEQDRKQAFECFKKAGEHNKQGIADYFLADFYSLGICVEQNDRLADIHKNRADSKKEWQYFDIERLLENADEKHRNRFLHLEINYDIECGRFNSARNKIKENIENNPNEMKFALSYLDKAEQLVHKNQELEETNKKLKEAQIELEDMMSMFAHKFRSPLDAIIYNTTHENQVKLYTEAAQTMRGLLDIFSLISTDAALLKRKLMADNYGNGRLATTFSKALDMVLLHLLTNSNREKVRQHYIAHAKLNGKVASHISRKVWREDYFELEQSLQTDWEQGFATLILQSASLTDKLDWVSKYFFPIQLIGFDREDIEFEEYGITESLLMMVINEIAVNVFKYYSCETKQPVIIECVKKDGSQVIICRNPSYGSERTIFKGSQKGHVFLSTLARNIGSHFVKPIPQDEFVVEFGIPNELLISNK